MHEEIVWSFLENNHVVLTGDIIKIAEDLGYQVESYSQAKELNVLSDIDQKDLRRPSFSFVDPNHQRHILYSDDLSREKTRSCILHEIGHFVMNMSYGGEGEDGNFEERAKKENEANIFLYEFYPSPVLFKAGIIDYDDIAEFTRLDAETVREIYKHVKAYANGKKWNGACDRICDTYMDIIRAANIGKEEAGLWDRPRIKRVLEMGVMMAIAIAVITIASVVVASYAGRRVEPLNTSSVITSTTRATININSLIDAANQEAGSSTDSAESSDITGSNTRSDWASHNDSLVYVTVSGEKYHLPDCYHIKNKDGLREMTAEEAEAAGYEPCLTCFG